MCKLALSRQGAECEAGCKKKRHVRLVRMCLFCYDFIIRWVLCYNFNIVDSDKFEFVEVMEKAYMIRKADKQDIPRIAEIIVFGKRVAYRPIFENDYVSFNELQVVNLYEEYKSNPDRLDGMLLYDDGVVKGVINGQLIDDKTIEITDFYVEPFFVRQGIGTLLIEYLIQQVRKKGVHKIVLWVIKDNVKARKFYEANGFVNSGKTCIIQGTIKEDCCYEYVLE